MSTRRFVTISLLLIFAIIIVIVVGNFSDIYAANIYRYEPCGTLHKSTQTRTAFPTQTPIAYPVLSPEKSPVMPYPALPLPTATPIICSCPREWVTATFSLFRLQYPHEALISIDPEGMSLRIPTCYGGTHKGIITVKISDNDENLDIKEFVNREYLEIKKVRYRETKVNGTNSIELYQTASSKNRIVFIPHQDKFIMFALAMPSGKAMMMPGPNGEIWIDEPSWEELGFFQAVLDTVELVE